MKYCNECKEEYEDFAKVCSDCGQALSNYEIIEEVHHPVPEPLNILKLCSSNEEANLLISLLDHHGIYSVIKYEGTGSYLNILHGRNYQGVYVLVQSSDYEDAQIVLNDFSYSHQTVADEYESKETKKYSYKRKIISLYIIMHVLGGLMVSLFLRMFYS